MDLTKEKTDTIALIARAGCPDAMQELWVRSYPIAERVAWGCGTNTYPKDDIVGDLMLAFRKIILNYRTRDGDFETFIEVRFRYKIKDLFRTHDPSGMGRRGKEIAQLKNASEFSVSSIRKGYLDADSCRSR